MSEINKCTRVTISGGQDPQTLDISAIVSSTGINSSVELSYCVNGGAAQGVVNNPITPAMPVSGLTYTPSISGLNSGDFVDIKVLANVATMVGDTGSLCMSGTAMQTDANDCSISAAMPQSCCDWTAVDELGSLLPDCSILPASINCDDLPYTVPAIPNSTSVVVTITGTDYSYTGGQIVDTTSGSGGAATATVTASNGNAAQDCTATITIAECTSGLGFVGEECPMLRLSESSPASQDIILGTLSGSGPITISDPAWEALGFSVEENFLGEIILVVPANFTGSVGPLPFTVTRGGQSFTCDLSFDVADI